MDRKNCQAQISGAAAIRRSMGRRKSRREPCVSNVSFDVKRLARQQCWQYRTLSYAITFAGLLPLIFHMDDLDQIKSTFVCASGDLRRRTAYSKSRMNRARNGCGRFSYKCIRSMLKQTKIQITRCSFKLDQGPRVPDQARRGSFTKRGLDTPPLIFNTQHLNQSLFLARNG